MFSKWQRRVLLPLSVATTFTLGVPTSRAAFHLWQIKEAYSNSDGSVQFIEMFDSFSGENSIGSFSLQTNSGGTIKTFTFPSSIDFSKDTTNHSIVIATPGFAGLPGGITPDFTLPDPATNGPFFNPNASTILITYNGSGDSMSFTGASFPKDGVHSLTDTNLYNAPNLVSGVNSPTNINGQSGSVNLAPEPTSGVMLLLLSCVLFFGRARGGRRCR
jgi:serralysin